MRLQPRTAAAEVIRQFDESKQSVHIKQSQTIFHPGEVQLRPAPCAGWPKSGTAPLAERPRKKRPAGEGAPGHAPGGMQCDAIRVLTLSRNRAQQGSGTVPN